MACTPFALLAKENGTEECDAALKEVLAQAKATASAVFLREILPILNETKKSR